MQFPVDRDPPVLLNEEGYLYHGNGQPANCFALCQAAENEGRCAVSLL
jgi:hypothetical protein